MIINLAHIQDQGINFAVFEADAVSRTERGRRELLDQLTFKARASGLRVEKSALAFMEGGRINFFGTPDLVRYLAGGWIPHWTHTINL